MGAHLEQYANKAGYRDLQPWRVGGSARIWKAKSLHTGDDVALKILSAGVDSQKLDREIGILKSLDHQNIVPYFHSGDFGVDKYLATKWIDGDTLATCLQRSGPFLLEDALQIFKQLVAALSAVHATGIIHNDISPDNVILDSFNKVTLIDFGIASHCGIADKCAAVTLTAENLLGGKPRYIAPEVIRGQDANEASDQYSLAIVLYELLTGSWPYKGTANIANALHHHLHSLPEPANEVKPQLPATIDRALQRALSKQPDDRFRTLSEFQNALTSPKHSGANQPSTHWKVASSFVLVGLLSVGSGMFFQSKSEATSGRSVIDSDNCKPISLETFESKKLGKNYYVSQDGVERIKIVGAAAGVESAMIKVGFKNEFGIYGVITPVKPGKHYDLSAKVLPVGGSFTASIFIEWLGANYGVLEGVRITQSLDTLKAGVIAIENAIAPAQAHFAVPSVFKDGSAGELYVDDIQFSAAQSDCQN